MKRVLVTGANGFIGRHTIGYLKGRGYEVHCITSGKGACDEDATWHICDLMDEDRCQNVMEEVKPTHLLHFAWYTEPGKYWESERNIDWMRSSLSLLKCFSDAGGKRATFAGTCAEYDWKYCYCSEGVTPTNPVTLYGVCKNSLRQVAEAFSERAGVSFSWGRVFFLYGPGERPSRFVPSVIRPLLVSREAMCTSGEQIRDFLYSRDVASAFVALMDGSVRGAVNIASGKPIALKDIAIIIGSKMGSSGLIRLGAIPTPVGEPPLIVADTRRLNNEVGWKPEYSLERGLDETIEWWRASILK